MGSLDEILDVNEDDKIERSSLGGSSGSVFRIEKGSFKGMLVGEGDGKLGGSEHRESLGSEGGSDIGFSDVM